MHVNWNNQTQTNFPRNLESAHVYVSLGMLSSQMKVASLYIWRQNNFGKGSSSCLGSRFIISLL